MDNKLLNLLQIKGAGEDALWIKVGGGRKGIGCCWVGDGREEEVQGLLSNCVRRTQEYACHGVGVQESDGLNIFRGRSRKRDWAG